MSDDQGTLLPDLAPMPEILLGDARALPLADESVDLICTSPPYFGLRDYGTPGQLGAEPTPAEFIKALIECTAEMVRVLKPSGSIFVNLGDKYSGVANGRNMNGVGGKLNTKDRGPVLPERKPERPPVSFGSVPYKSLALLPERYRIAAVDQLGLIARAVIVWSKPNGLPESVTDRVRRSHEDWVHLTKSPRYFASVDEIREPHAPDSLRPSKLGATSMNARNRSIDGGATAQAGPNPLGKLPGSVWNIPTQPLRVPAELGVDHFAAFPMEWPRRIIRGWCPAEVCTVCGEGRRPVVSSGGETSTQRRERLGTGENVAELPDRTNRTTPAQSITHKGAHPREGKTYHVTGYACACPDTTAPSTPGTVLDPFGGTGTTAIVACALGRRGISVDLNPDYKRLAEWRAADPKQRAKAAGVTAHAARTD